MGLRARGTLAPLKRQAAPASASLCGHSRTCRPSPPPSLPWRLTRKMPSACPQHPAAPEGPSVQGRPALLAARLPWPPSSRSGPPGAEGTRSSAHTSLNLCLSAPLFSSLYPSVGTCPRKTVDWVFSPLLTFLNPNEAMRQVAPDSRVWLLLSSPGLT